jgi:hypothetical protein
MGGRSEDLANLMRIRVRIIYTNPTPTTPSESPSVADVCDVQPERACPLEFDANVPACAFLGFKCDGAA